MAGLRMVKIYRFTVTNETATTEEVTEQLKGIVHEMHQKIAFREESDAVKVRSLGEEVAKLDAILKGGD